MKFAGGLCKITDFKKVVKIL